MGKGLCEFTFPQCSQEQLKSRPLPGAMVATGARDVARAVLDLVDNAGTKQRVGGLRGRKCCSWSCA